MPKTKTRKIKKSNSQTGTQKDAFIKALIFSFISYLLIYVISCLIALAFDLSDGYDFYVSLTCFALASFCSGFYSGNKLRKNGLVTGLIFTLPANAVLIIISVILTDFAPDISLLISAAVLLLSSAAGGICAVNKRHRR